MSVSHWLHARNGAVRLRERSRILPCLTGLCRVWTAGAAIILFGLVGWAQPVRNAAEENFANLQGDFRRWTRSPFGSDTVGGRFYYLGRGRVVVEVTRPLKQIMSIQANRTTIYYPDERRAFVLESERPPQLPIISSLLMAARPDLGLPGYGFILVSHGTQGDTLVATYELRGKGRAGPVRFTVGEVNGRAVFASYASPDSQSWARTKFDRHVDVGGLWFPTEISTVASGMGATSEEVLRVEGLTADQPLPAWVLDFHLPKGIKVEKKKW
jgi:hypothetical protein